MSTEHLALCLSVERYVYWVTGLEHLCSNTMVEIKREGLRLPSNRPELLEAAVVGSVHWPAMYYCKQAKESAKQPSNKQKTNKQTPALVVDDPAETQSWLQSSVPQVQTELVWEINFNILLGKCMTALNLVLPYPLLAIRVIKGVTEEVFLNGAVSDIHRVFKVVLLGNSAPCAGRTVDLWAKLELGTLVLLRVAGVAPD